MPRDFTNDTWGIKLSPNHHKPHSRRKGIQHNKSANTPQTSANEPNKDSGLQAENSTPPNHEDKTNDDDTQAQTPHKDSPAQPTFTQDFLDISGASFDSDDSNATPTPSRLQSISLPYSDSATIIEKSTINDASSSDGKHHHSTNKEAPHKSSSDAEGSGAASDDSKQA